MTTRWAVFTKAWYYADGSPSFSADGGCGVVKMPASTASSSEASLCRPRWRRGTRASAATLNRVLEHRMVSLERRKRISPSDLSEWTQFSFRGLNVVNVFDDHQHSNPHDFPPLAKKNFNFKKIVSKFLCLFSVWVSLPVFCQSQFLPVFASPNQHSTFPRTQHSSWRSWRRRAFFLEHFIVQIQGYWPVVCVWTCEAPPVQRLMLIAMSKRGISL